MILAKRSQWSLTFEVRKRAWGEASGVTTGESSQWSLTFEVRKRPTSPTRPRPRGYCRNGA